MPIYREEPPLNAPSTFLILVLQPLSQNQNFFNFMFVSRSGTTLRSSRSRIGAGFSTAIVASHLTRNLQHQPRAWINVASHASRTLPRPSQPLYFLNNSIKRVHRRESLASNFSGALFAFRTINLLFIRTSQTPLLEIRHHSQFF
jgi:hypothetical protein